MDKLWCVNMYCCRYHLFTLKRMLALLLCLAVIAYVLIMYYKSCSLLIYPHAQPYFAKAETLQWTFWLPSCRMPPDDRKSQGLRAPGRPLVYPAPPQNVMCNSHRGKGITTSCSSCIRPRVYKLHTSFQEILSEDILLANQSAEYFKIRPAILEPLVTSYLIVPSFTCSDVYLLALQPSMLDRRQERDTVRSTWGSVAREQKWPNRIINANVKVIFVVARQLLPDMAKKNSGKITQLLEMIKAEATSHNDILFVDIVDSYRNLTLKILSAFKWVKDNCPCVKFVLKVDYDTFVNVPLLVDTLLYFENRFEFSILGKGYTHERYVLRRGRWAVPESLYPMSSYPYYTSGCGYVLSYSALSRIVDAAPHFRMLPIEDAFITGVMRRVIGCRMFSFYTMFTHHTNDKWDHCLMLEDRKILGMTYGGSKHQFLWESFLTSECV